MKKGVNAWIYPSEFSIDRILESSAEIGFDGVELNLNEEILEFSGSKRRTVREKAESLGLELQSLCTGLLWKYNLASPDEKIRRRGIDIIKRGCEFASDIGSKVLLVVPAVATPEVS